MKKGLISMMCLSLSMVGILANVEATNFEGKENTYIKLCSSSSLTNSQYNTCKEFNSYLKKKNNALKNSINSSNKKIDETQASLDDVVSKIASLNSEIQKKQEEIDYLEKSIKALEDNIAAKESEVKDRMYVMQSYNNSNQYIDFIFGASNFSDFFARIDSINEITSFDEELISKINEEKAQVESQKNTIVSAKENIVLQRNEQATLQTQYENIINKQQQEIAAAKKEQEKISNTQTSLDSFLSSVIINNPSNSTSKPTNIPSTNKYGSIVVSAAYSKLGCPYVWGAEGPNTFDCSGLVMWCYRQAGVYLDHYSGSQANSGAVIPLSQAQPGDILWRSGHVGIYIGNGKFIHAPQTGDVVKISSVAGYGKFKYAVRPY